MCFETQKQPLPVLWHTLVIVTLVLPNIYVTLPYICVYAKNVHE